MPSSRAIIPLHRRQRSMMFSEIRWERICVLFFSLGNSDRSFLLKAALRSPSSLSSIRNPWFVSLTVPLPSKMQSRTGFSGGSLSLITIADNLNVFGAILLSSQNLFHEYLFLANIINAIATIPRIGTQINVPIEPVKAILHVVLRRKK